MKNSFYTSFGVWLIIIPFLGIPSLWRSRLTLISGIFLVIISIAPVILKKLESGARIKKVSKSAVKKDEMKKEDNLRFSNPDESGTPNVT